MPTALPSLDRAAARKHCESSAWGPTSVASARALGRTHGENEVAHHQVVALESRGVEGVDTCHGVALDELRHRGLDRGQIRPSSASHGAGVLLV